jgi:hypothetical protein
VRDDHIRMFEGVAVRASLRRYLDHGADRGFTPGIRFRVLCVALRASHHRITALDARVEHREVVRQPIPGLRVGLPRAQPGIKRVTVADSSSGD